jgi:predicted GNAT family N-acyltransferase
MENGIRFTRSQEERQAAYQLRYKTYVKTMGRFNNSCDHDRQELHDEYDKTARIIIAVKNNKIIGTLRVLWGKDLAFDHNLVETYRIKPFLNILDPSKICIVERLMVDENHRGSATMLRMFNAVMEFILTQKIELLLINAEAHLSNSYIKLGCKSFAKQHIYPGIGPVTPMALVVGDYQHLKIVRSPFSLLAAAGDVDYCQHTQQLVNIIHREAKLAMIIAPHQQMHSIIPLSPAANHPIFSKRPSDLGYRLRAKLANV